jgi:hypothetical protein
MVAIADIAARRIGPSRGAPGGGKPRPAAAGSSSSAIHRPEPARWLLKPDDAHDDAAGKPGLGAAACGAASRHLAAILFLWQHVTQIRPCDTGVAAYWRPMSVGGCVVWTDASLSRRRT